MPRILIVEDDEHLGRGLEINLVKAGFEVLRARKGETAVAMALRTEPDLITLDVMLPDMSGFDVCRDLRRRGINVPIIMLTARGEEIDRIVGFEIGADDYVPKPFSVRELVARIRAFLRRAGASSPDVFRFGDVEVHLKRFLVTRAGQTVALTAKEFDILRLLIRHRGEVIGRDRILDEIWHADASVTTRTIDTHVMNLRRKLEADPSQPHYLTSVYGEGYRFVG